MNETNQAPYVARCSFCDQGLLRLIQCPLCETVVAVCDECELVWRDVAAVSADPRLSSSSAFPGCPECRTKIAEWTRLTRDEIDQVGLGVYVRGASD